MTDFLLALASFAGLLVYATIGVAVYRFGSERTSTPYTLAASLLSAWLVAAGVTALVAITTTLRHTPGVWAVFPGIVLGLGAIAVTLMIGTGDVERVVLPALWPVAGAVWLVLRVGVPAVVGIATHGARGPLALGTWLAELPGRRERARVARDQEIAARRERIAAMEKELGL